MTTDPISKEDLSDISCMKAVEPGLVETNEDTHVEICKEEEKTGRAEILSVLAFLDCLEKSKKTC